jgi:molybdate transport system permease protein
VGSAILTPAGLDALRISVQVATAAVAVSLPLAIAAAWLLARLDFPGRTLFDALVHLPLVVGCSLLLLLGTRGPLGG